MTNQAYCNVSDIILEIVNVAEDGLGSVDIHRTLKRRLRGKVCKNNKVSYLQKSIILYKKVSYFCKVK